MASTIVPAIRVQREDFDVAAEIAALTKGRADIGAVVTFSGLCRDEQGALTALELEHYPGMAEAEIGRIAAEAIERWPLQGL
ncbi:molybdenum cofactor biosynthesis protein MoaE, partial [Mesorhizobium sp. M2D.F.Ca.ET.224.01.1.1]